MHAVYAPVHHAAVSAAYLPTSAVHHFVGIQFRSAKGDTADGILTTSLLG